MSYQANEKRYDTMTYRHAGSSGLCLPAVSLGLWHNFGGAATRERMQALCFTAFDAGITHFDLANNYGPPPGSAEENFGRILKEELHAYRDELIISTKAGYDMWQGPYGSGGSRKYLLASLDQSLLRMGIPYVDIFYHHRMTPDTPLEESMLALDTAVKSGRALYAGLSNYDAPTMQRAAAILQELHCPFVINQNSYSILNRGAEHSGILDAAQAGGKGMIIFSPLSQGLLSDRYLDGIPADSRIRTDGRFLKESSLTPATLQKLRALQQLARERGQTLAQMALAWVFSHPAVTSVLIGASRPEQITENIAMLQNTSFSEAEYQQIERIALCE